MKSIKNGGGREVEGERRGGREWRGEKREGGRERLEREGKG